MKLQRGNFIVTRTDKSAETSSLEQEGLVLGRLPSCDIELNHLTVSRIHAGINRVGNDFYLINLSSSNTLTLNGRVLNPEQADVLADGDVIQIGVFAVVVNKQADKLALNVTQQIGSLTSSKLPGLASLMPPPKETSADVADVLKVFWEKRTREKDESDNPLRPRGKPLPGKARINWKPTGDLRRSWRASIFSWSLILLGTLSFAAFFVYPNFFSPAALSSPHARRDFKSSSQFGNIAVKANADSCTTCHTLTQTVEQTCINCHSADAFHATNMAQHQAAGIGCTTCHAEHQGADFEPRLAALESCANCHNDQNKTLYNGKAVFTPHGGTLGYPIKDGNWTWEGSSKEELAMKPEVTKFETQANDENGRRNIQFHALHLGRMGLPDDTKGDKTGMMSCSSCHASFDPIDRETPKATCAKCHNGYVDMRTKQTLITADKANCVSCHIQHNYSQNRWRDYLSDGATTNRSNGIAAQIKNLSK